MTILTKVWKLDNFESHNSLNLSVTNIQGLQTHFFAYESFLELNLPGALALYARSLEDSVD